MGTLGFLLFLLTPNMVPFCEVRNSRSSRWVHGEFAITSLPYGCSDLNCNAWLATGCAVPPASCEHALNGAQMRTWARRVGLHADLDDTEGRAARGASKAPSAPTGQHAHLTRPVASRRRTGAKPACRLHCQAPAWCAHPTQLQMADRGTPAMGKLLDARRAAHSGVTHPLAQEPRATRGKLVKGGADVAGNEVGLFVELAQHHLQRA